MNVSATQSSLERFLEVKRAAEQRLKLESGSRSGKTGRAQESFMDIIKSLKKKDDNTIIDAPAPAARPASTAKSGQTRAADGLLAVYGMNRILSSSLSESPAREAIARTRHLGNFIDAVA